MTQGGTENTQQTLHPSLYRKRPVTIEAMLYTRESFDAVRDWLGDSYVRAVSHNGGVSAFRLHTLEGVMAATRGDWIVKGVKGEFYPVRADIFEQTYEIVDV